MSSSVAIIDYKMGNLFSVERACQKVGLTPIITSSREEILNADCAILPGVGAFGAAMTNLKELSLIDTIHSFISTGKPFMGVCLGMHLLMSTSEEFGNHTGLNVIPGSVKRFPNVFNDIKIKVPMVGWGRIQPTEADAWQQTILQKIKKNEFMYFVHSYYVQPENKTDILSTTSYAGFRYCSTLRRKNVFASQYHPEKSGPEGLKIYQQFKKFI